MKALEYNLPDERIAYKPKEQRSNSKLLYYHSGEITHDSFSSLPKILKGNYNLVLNETKVVNARIHFRKPSGGLIEVFCLEPDKGDVTEQLAQSENVVWKCMVGGAKKWKDGVISAVTEFRGEKLALTAEKVSFHEGVFTLQFEWSIPSLSFSEVLEVFGKIPLPPYIKRPAEESDTLRYQTVFAKNEGSVAAPTASLHFTEEILDKLESTGVKVAKVNLHVGAGTFKPISDAVEDHEMHHELFEVNTSELDRLSDLKNILAVGTTAVRTLESLYLLAIKLKTKEDADLREPQVVEQWEWKELEDPFANSGEAFAYLYERCSAESVEKISGYTSLMIVPGFKFKVIKGLITNFHMPKSTLLFLVAALIGEDWRDVYAHALENNYRFLSYGDSSLLIP